MQFFPHARRRRARRGADSAVDGANHLTKGYRPSPESFPARFQDKQSIKTFTAKLATNGADSAQRPHLKASDVRSGKDRHVRAF
jgi:hypothetical protein